MSAAASAACGGCRHFSSSAAELERAIPGLVSLGSGYGSVRAGDGLCRLHDRYLSGAHHCEHFEARRTRQADTQVVAWPESRAAPGTPPER